MKIRNGFVSNSSSSSFIILLETITDEQKQMIYDHIKIGKQVDFNLKLKGLEPIYEYYEDWNIKEDDFSIWACTSMDNFRLQDFVVREVKIPFENIIKIGDGYWYNLYDDPEYLKLKRSKKLKKIKKNIKNDKS